MAMVVRRERTHCLEERSSDQLAGAFFRNDGFHWYCVGHNNGSVLLALVVEDQARQAFDFETELARTRPA